MTERVILALDVGSSSVRCTSYHLQTKDNDANDEKMPSIKPLFGCNAYKTIRSVEPNTGKIRLEHTLFHQIDLCVDETLRSLRKHYSDSSLDFKVVGLGFSSFVMNLIAVDEEGEVLGSEASISYACNTPDVVEQCRQLRMELGPEKVLAIHQRTGAPLHSAYALPQLLALYSDPEGPCKNAYVWQTVASACMSRWTGRDFLPISYSEASWTGLFNFRTCEWDDELLDLLPVECREALPPLADTTDPSVMEIGIQEFPQCLSAASDASTYVNPYWNRWPELRGPGDSANGSTGNPSSSFCRLFLGMGDGACANIGSKCSTPSRIAVTVGTSAAARVCLPLKIGSEEELIVPQGLFCYRVDRSHVLLGGALTDGGSMIEWARSLLNLENDDDFDTVMKKVKKLSEAEYEMKNPEAALSMIPFLSGERSTGFRFGATGGMLGLTRSTTPAHFVKACMEGVTLRIQAILNVISEALKQSHDNVDDGPTFIIASGNALEKNSQWRQMIADCSGMVVELDSDTSEGTSRGVAKMVATSLAMIDAKSSESAKFMDKEHIAASAVAEPNVVATEGYWKSATLEQDLLIAAVSPLWN